MESSHASLVASSKPKQPHHKSDSCNILESYFTILCEQKHPHGPRIFCRISYILVLLHWNLLFRFTRHKNYRLNLNYESLFSLNNWFEIYYLLQFIKVKITPVLFTLTRLEAKMWAHFARYIPAKNKEETIPTRACWVYANHKNYIHIYLKGKYMKKYAIYLCSFFHHT